MSDDTEVETKGGVTVRLSGEDLTHLLTHGRASVTKDAGPLEIKVQADAKVYHKIVLDDRNGQSRTIASAEGDADE